jgi:CubicO group peptidase (beta-lactamase class C family)
MLRAVTGIMHTQRLAAILGADAAGYSRLTSADNRDALAALDAARAVFKARIASVFAAGLLAFASALPEAAEQVRYHVSPVRNDGWTPAHADSAGVDPDRLASMTAAIRAAPELGVHAILIERDGSLIYEEYFDGFDERGGWPLGKVSMTMETRHDLRSVTKSVVSALVGIAHAEGAIRSLDEPLVAWFPEYPEADTPERRRVTLTHALTMTSGFEWNEHVPYTDPRNDEIRMNRDPQPLRFALTRPLADDPGRAFNYNGGLVQMMAAVIQRATKTPFQEYARAKVFEPLGITDVEWTGALGDMPSAASGLRLRPRDLAKFGSLYLHGGRWNGKQVIPGDWIELSTRRHVRFPPPPSAAADAMGEFGYGYFWWYACNPTPAGLSEARFAVGNGEQRIIVYPGLEMVVTILAGRYNDPTAAGLTRRITREHVIPAVKTSIRTGCPGAAL